MLPDNLYAKGGVWWSGKGCTSELAQDQSTLMVLAADHAVTKRDLVASHGTGQADVDEVRDLADEAWLEILEDSDDTARVAELLGVSVDELRTAYHAPLSIKQGREGTGVVEGALLVYTAPLAMAAAKGAATFIGAQIARTLWRKFVLPRIRRKNRDAVGPENRY
jgi:hypothetical protein